MDQFVARKIRQIYGEDVYVKDHSPIPGGDINEAYLLELSNDERVFLKRNYTKDEDFFKAEAAGLAAIASTNTIDAAKVLATGYDGRSSYLLLEYIEKGGRNGKFWEIFGKRLARMHRADTSAILSEQRFGFSSDNYIGGSVQKNTPMDSWIDFFRTKRLEIQFKMAWNYFEEADRRRILKLLGLLDGFLAEPRHPSLLHGDLWSGNFMASSSGKPILIDPAVYVGHFEADLAMTELFGGFSSAFYDSYREENLVSDGYEDRKDLYPEIYVNLKDLENRDTDTFVAVWTETQDLYLMSAETYRDCYSEQSPAYTAGDVSKTCGEYA